MLRLFKAFLFKISKDLTFRITLIIGAGLAVLMTAIYAGIQYGLFEADASDPTETAKFISGQGMFINSMSPVQNYGLAIPINLITFICLEFSQGTIRNKIIAGHSKFKIYTSLFLGGLIFAFALLAVYLLICTALGSIFGGFNLNDLVYSGMGFSKFTLSFLIRKAIICVLTYITIVSFVVFISTTFRNVGPCIPLVMIPMMILYVASTIIPLMVSFEEGKIDWMEDLLRIFNPLHALSSNEVKAIDEYTSESIVSNFTFIAGIVNNLVYTALFFVFGSILFKKRDVK